ncbi:MAG: hypothetical protein GY806_09045 [Gammaproteobacteria bacterium]|nr:hypothetical protein [Gammaproteobacteria bacterium]
MLTKILLTLSVIVVCAWLISARRNNPELKSSRAAGKETLARQKQLRQAAWAFMGAMVAAAVIMMTVELWDKNALVTVHVINTQSGERISYQARREDVSQNSFTTVEGRKIFTAGVERIEIEVVE